VLLHFNALGYTPVQLAMLFVLYECCGVVTNLLGGWIGSWFGLKVTLTGGLVIQIIALLMLAGLDPAWTKAVSVVYVMAAQALSGIAKDLTKMSAKSAIKFLVPAHAESTLFRWVAILTGSKNALKGVGFFLGGMLLSLMGYRWSLIVMGVGMVGALVGTGLALPRDLGKAKTKKSFASLFSPSRDINVLSAARFFLFGARDIWFVVGVPVFLYSVGWTFSEVGSFLAAWVIGYGLVQSAAPLLIGWCTGGKAPGGLAASLLAAALTVVMTGAAVGLLAGWPAIPVIMLGLGFFGIVFAINSSVHSYLVLAYSRGDAVVTNVGFYYMANAGGRLAGTVLSGLVYQKTGVVGCLCASAASITVATVISAWLPTSSNGSPLDTSVEASGD